MSDLELEQLMVAAVTEEDWATAQLCEESLNGSPRVAARARETLDDRDEVRRGYLARQIDSIVALMTGHRN